MPLCPRCGHDNAEGAKFCSECGEQLAAAAARPARESRRTVTVVFCDVTGSTSLGERLDPESLRSVMSRYFDRMRSVLEAHGGTVEKFIGDAVMAVFGIPSLHEDDALRAVRAADEMREALGELNDDLERDLSVSLAVRIGVNTGEVVAGDPAAGQALVTGDAVNTAARLEQAAAPGEILIGDHTFHLVRDAVEAEPVDPLALKGKLEAVGAYRLLSVTPGAAGHERRLDSPMVGRERPLRMLLDAFDNAAADGACHLFTVLGPAGIGKSRLVREFVSQLGSRATALTGRCLSYGEGITYWPVAEIAIQAAGIAEDDPPDRARAALGRVLEASSDGPVVAGHLAGLLGLDGDGPVEAPWAVRRLLEELARERPLVAIFDDIHWAEPALLDVIDHVADRTRDAPILLLCMARPELLDEHPGWGGGKRNATSVHLEPLSEPEADELIENLLGHPALTPEIRERIRAAAQGNPLFVEEMLAYMVDGGVLVQKDGEWVATVDLTTVEVPPAISALLASRLDRLSGDERVVLEAASVVGEVFERSTVHALVPERVRGGVDPHLGSLLRKDLIRPSRSDVGGEDAYRFRHILLRDAAYEAVPKAERAGMHETFAQHLQTSLGERASELEEFTGYHLEQAHRLRSELGMHDERTAALAQAAFEHLAAAGRRAFQRGDMAAAANLLGRASELLDPDDPERLRLAWRLGFALFEAGSIAAAVDLLDATVRRARDVGDEVAAAYAEAILWNARLLQDPSLDINAWEAVADRLISTFEEMDDHQGAAIAWAQKAYALWLRQRVEASGVAGERAIEHARAAGDRLLEIDMLAHRTATLGVGPRPLAEAAAFGDRVLEEARARGERRLEQAVLRGLGFRHAFRGEFDEARRLIATGRAIQRDLGLTVEYWASAQNSARVAWMAGDLEEAERDLRESCEQLELLGETAFLSTSAAMLAQLEIELGDLDAAARWLEVAERTAAAGDSASQREIELVRGLLFTSRADPAGERHLRRALELADETDAFVPRFEGRIVLAKAIADRRPDEAAELAGQALEIASAKGAPVLIAQAEELLAATR